MVSQAGAVLLVETARKTGLDAAMSAALERWRKPRAVHDPGKILLDVALALALGGNCLADVALLRAEPTVFGPVASDPTGLSPDRTAGLGRQAGPWTAARSCVSRATTCETDWRCLQRGHSDPEPGSLVGGSGSQS